MQRAKYSIQRKININAPRGYCVSSGILYKPRAAATATACLWARMQTVYRVLLFSVAVKAVFAGMWRAAKNSMAFLFPPKPKTADTVEIYEAPINAMSGATLRQFQHDGSWRKVHRLALGGLNHQPIDYFLQQHPKVGRVELCFDRDEPGRNFTKIVTKRLTERGYAVHNTPPCHWQGL